MAGQPAPGSNGILTFDVTKIEVVRQLPPTKPPALPGILQEPQSIIPVDRGFVAKVGFDVGGIFARYVVNKKHPYSITVHAESIGDGPEKDIATLDSNLVDGELNYTVDVNVPASVLPVGVYKLIAVLTFNEPFPQGPPMIGFTENPIMIQIKERIW